MKSRTLLEAVVAGFWYVLFWAFVCSAGAYVFFHGCGTPGEPNHLKETVLIVCKQGDETVFDGPASGEPTHLNGTLRIKHTDGNLTVLDAAAHCVTTTMRPPTTAK